VIKKRDKEKIIDLETRRAEKKQQKEEREREKIENEEFIKNATTDDKEDDSKTKTQSRFKLGSNKLPKNTQGNIRLALKLLGVVVRYNLFEDRPTIEGLKGFDSLNDAAMDRLWLTIDQKFGFRPPKEFFWTVVFDEARLNPFHPVRESPLYPPLCRQGGNAKTRCAAATSYTLLLLFPPVPPYRKEE
jgi:hypothetical protein